MDRRRWLVWIARAGVVVAALGGLVPAGAQAESGEAGESGDQLARCDVLATGVSGGAPVAGVHWPHSRFCTKAFSLDEPTAVEVTVEAPAGFTGTVRSYLCRRVDGFCEGGASSHIVRFLAGRPSSNPAVARDLSPGSWLLYVFHDEYDQGVAVPAWACWPPTSIPVPPPQTDVMCRVAGLGMTTAVGEYNVVVAAR